MLRVRDVLQSAHHLMLQQVARQSLGALHAPLQHIPRPLQKGEGYAYTDVGGRATHGAVAEGEGSSFKKHPDIS